MTTPLPSRSGPSVRMERALEMALARTLTTDNASTVRLDSARAAGGATGLGCSCAAPGSGPQRHATSSAPATLRIIPPAFPPALVSYILHRLPAVIGVILRLSPSNYTECLLTFAVNAPSPVAAL